MLPRWKPLLIALFSAFLLVAGGAAAADEALLTLHKSAREDYQAGRTAEAVRKFEEILARDPSFIPAYNDLGCCYMEMGDAAKALEKFKKAHDISPDDRSLLYNLSLAYEASGDTASALSSLEKLLSVDPGFSKARKKIVDVLIKSGDLDRAQSEAQKLIDSAPQNPSYRKVLVQVLLHKGNVSLAKEELQQVLAAAPSDTEARELLEKLNKSGATVVASPVPGNVTPSPSPAPAGGGTPALIPVIAAIGAALVVISILYYALAGKKAPALPYDTISHLEEEGPFHPQEKPEPVPIRGKPAAVTQAIPLEEPASACWQLHQCAKETRAKCAAFLENSNCWSLESTACCRKDRALCVTCSYYSHRLQKTRKAPTAAQEREFVLKTGDSVLLDKVSNPQMAFLQELSDSLTSNELDELASTFIHRMSGSIFFERAAIFAAEREKENELALLASFQWGDEASRQTELACSTALFSSWVSRNSFPMTLKKAREEQTWRLIFTSESEKALSAFELLHPLTESGTGKLLGMVLLGKKKNNQPYSASETNFITLAAGIYSTSLEKARAYKLAVFDGLTGLYVVRYFQERLKDELKSRRTSIEDCSLIMSDIDHFKKFNDTYGHQQGDTVLREVARLIKAGVRKGDIAARYGGEEMSVILPSTGKSVAFEVAERIRKAIERSRFPGLPEGVRVTISMGIATFPRDGTTPEDLIKKADMALYEAKHSGRNRTCSHQG
ncbi:MAG: diguanylate cyclase [Candidatus Eremiobacteraeota bacterium]|nr:diguanylate cyclase [Candidatus Eremiobacteraeota bacterium]